MKRISAILVALAISANAVPVSLRAQSRQEQQAIADQRMLQETVTRLQQRVNQLDEQVRTLTRQVEEQGTANVRGFATQQDLIKGLQSSLATSGAKLDENTTRVLQLAQEFSGISKGLGQVTELLNTMLNLLQPPGSAAGPDTASGGPAAGALAPVASPASAGRIFESAYGEYMGGHYEIAVGGFQEYLQKFPDSPTAGKAQAYLGQALYQQKKYREALAAFDKLVKTYRNSDQVAEAYFMQGQCYEALMQLSDARRVYDLVKTLFPTSTQAIQATQRLSALSSTTPAR